MRAAFRRLRVAVIAVGLGAGVLVGPASASLTLFNSFTGNEGVSTDGCASFTATCTLQSNIPLGSTIQAAYLYSSFVSFISATPSFDASLAPNTILRLGGESVTPTFTPLGVSNGILQAWRADVTTFVQSHINIGSLTTWTADEGSQTSIIDGEALVVVFSNPAQATQTVFILDGFSDPIDSSTVLTDPLAAGFTAEMMVGDGFSFDGSSLVKDPLTPVNTGQVTRITVNGTTLTSVAGHCDDNQDGNCQNGSLLTMGATNAGSHDDPFTPFPCDGLTCVGLDHERYNLGNVLHPGDTTIHLTTLNPSGEDNIFVEVFDINGTAQSNPPTVPEPASLVLLGAGLAGLGIYFRRGRRR